MNRPKTFEEEVAEEVAKWKALEATRNIDPNPPPTLTPEQWAEHDRQVDAAREEEMKHDWRMKRKPKQN